MLVFYWLLCILKLVRACSSISSVKYLNRTTEGFLYMQLESYMRISLETYLTLHSSHLNILQLIADSSNMSITGEGSPSCPLVILSQNKDVSKPGGPMDHAWPRESDQSACYTFLLPAHPHNHQGYHC